MSNLPFLVPSRDNLLGTLVRPCLLAAIAALAAFVPLSSAQAAPITYGLTSGAMVVRASLAGQSDSIFLGSSSIQVPLSSATAVIDLDVSTYGRFESLEIVAEDFSADLDPTAVGIQSVDLSSPTLSSLTGSDLNEFGQFSLPSMMSADASGVLASGALFGSQPLESDVGSSVGMVFVSADQIMIHLVGVTVASIDAAEFGITDPDAPNVEIKVDFSLIGGAVSTPVPEPAAAFVFAVGLAIVGHRLNRFPDAAEDSVD